MVKINYKELIIINIFLLGIILFGIYSHFSLKKVLILGVILFTIGNLKYYLLKKEEK